MLHGKLSISYLKSCKQPLNTGDLITQSNNGVFIKQIKEQLDLMLNSTHMKKYICCIKAALRLVVVKIYCRTVEANA